MRSQYNRPFSATMMFEQMKFHMEPSAYFEIQRSGREFIRFHMFYLGDRKKVIHGGPWIFQVYGLTLEDCDGKIDPDKIALDGIYVWTQIQRVPDVYQHETIVDQLAHRIGRVREVQLSLALVL